jgi:hypothetical protein
MATERCEVELGFEGGGVARCTLGQREADELERRFRRGRGGLVSLASEDGPVVVDLCRVVYVRTVSRRQPIGFGDR